METATSTSESDLMTKKESNKSKQFCDEIKKAELESPVEDSINENDTLKEELFASGSAVNVDMKTGDTKKEKRELLSDNIGDFEGEHSKPVNEFFFASENICEQELENEMKGETGDSVENAETSFSTGVEETPTSESVGENEERKPNMKQTKSINVTSFTIDLSLRMKIGWRNRPSIKIRPNFQLLLN